MLVWLQLLVWPQDAPVETAKAIAGAIYDDPHYVPWALIIANGLAQRGPGANALAHALGEAGKQVRKHCSGCCAQGVQYNTLKPTTGWQLFAQTIVHLHVCCVPAFCLTEPTGYC
jgi:hypothetical protein